MICIEQTKIFFGIRHVNAFQVFNKVYWYSADSGEDVDGLPTEGVEITCFHLVRRYRSIIRIVKDANNNSINLQGYIMLQHLFFCNHGCRLTLWSVSHKSYSSSMWEKVNKLWRRFHYFFRTFLYWILWLCSTGSILHEYVFNSMTSWLIYTCDI